MKSRLSKKSIQRAFLGSTLFIISLLTFYLLLRSPAEAYLEPHVFTTEDFITMASDDLFHQNWSEMDNDSALTWTKRIRKYSRLFQFWEHFLLEEEKPTKATMQNIYQIMNSINHRMFSWLKVFQSNPLALKQTYLGRGIVMAVGDGQSEFAIVALKQVQSLGCTLPIEIFYDGSGDLSPDNINKLKNIPRVTVINIHDIVSDEISKVSGWAMKPFSLLMSSFREAILMDADVVWLENPEVIFEDELYKKVGTLFYKDRTMFEQGHMQSWIKSFIPPPWSDNLLSSRMWNGKSSHELESGVVAYDKKKRFLGILATTMINVSKLRDFFYKHIHGDKETFWIGPEMALEPYAVSKTTAGIIGPKPSVDDKGNPGRRTCSPQLLHFKESGEPLWFNQWIFENRFAAEPKFERLEVYASEPGKYELKDHNICCFEVDYGKEFKLLDEKHLQALENIRILWLNRNKD